MCVLQPEFRTNMKASQTTVLSKKRSGLIKARSFIVNTELNCMIAMLIKCLSGVDSTSPLVAIQFDVLRSNLTSRLQLHYNAVKLQLIIEENLLRCETKT